MARLLSLKDVPNTSREYETTYILRPNTTNEGVAEVNTRIKGVIESMGGKVLKVDNWGKRRLAYEVAKERKGIYIYWLYLAKSGVVEEAERNLRLIDNVIRYLTVKVDEDVIVEARPSEIDDASYDKAATTAADEEDLFLSRGSEDLLNQDDDGDVYSDDYPSEDFGGKPRPPKAAAAAEPAAATEPAAAAAPAAPAADDTKDKE